MLLGPVRVASTFLGETPRDFTPGRSAMGF
jgi:hypothetical protein